MATDTYKRKIFSILNTSNNQIILVTSKKKVWIHLRTYFILLDSSSKLVKNYHALINVMRRGLVWTFIGVNKSEQETTILVEQHEI